MPAVSACALQYVHEEMQMKFILSHTHIGCNEGVASEKMVLDMLIVQLRNTWETRRFVCTVMLRCSTSI